MAALSSVDLKAESRVGTLLVDPFGRGIGCRSRTARRLNWHRWGYRYRPRGLLRVDGDRLTRRPGRACCRRHFTGGDPTGCARLIGRPLAGGQHRHPVLAGLGTRHRRGGCCCATGSTAYPRLRDDRAVRTALLTSRRGSPFPPDLFNNGRPAEEWLSDDRGGHNWPVIRFGRGRRRHSHQYRYDPGRNADAQEHRAGGSSRRRGQRASNLRRCIRAGALWANAAGQYRLGYVGSIAPAQALAAWFGARLAQRITADNLSRIMAVALLGTGAVMLYSSVISG